MGAIEFALYYYAAVQMNNRPIYTTFPSCYQFAAVFFIFPDDLSTNGINMFLVYGNTLTGFRDSDFFYLFEGSVSGVSSGIKNQN
jgi:hypothetical protein